MNKWLTGGSLFATVVCVVAVALLASRESDCGQLDLSVNAFGLFGELDEDGQGNPTLVEQTNRIPLVQNASFGIQFIVSPTESLRRDEGELRFIWFFPSDSKNLPFRDNRLEQSYRVPLGQRTTVRYTLEHSWEMIPGQWRLEVWDGCERLSETTFFLSRANH